MAAFHPKRTLAGTLAGDRLSPLLSGSTGRPKVDSPGLSSRGSSPEPIPDATNVAASNAHSNWWLRNRPSEKLRRFSLGLTGQSALLDQVADRGEVHMSRGNRDNLAASQF